VSTRLLRSSVRAAKPPNNNTLGGAGTALIALTFVVAKVVIPSKVVAFPSTVYSIGGSRSNDERNCVVPLASPVTRKVANSILPALSAVKNGVTGSKPMEVNKVALKGVTVRVVSAGSELQPGARKISLVVSI
jgi:hypothetical protein